VVHLIIFTHGWTDCCPISNMRNCCRTYLAGYSNVWHHVTSGLRIQLFLIIPSWLSWLKLSSRCLQMDIRWVVISCLLLVIIRWRLPREHLHLIDLTKRPPLIVGRYCLFTYLQSLYQNGSRNLNVWCPIIFKGLRTVVNNVGWYLQIPAWKLINRILLLLK